MAHREPVRRAQVGDGRSVTTLTSEASATDHPRCVDRRLVLVGANLMKTFACGDVVPGCDARWSFPSEDEVLAAVAEHARVDHGLADVPPELVDQVRAAIVTSA